MTQPAQARIIPATIALGLTCRCPPPRLVPIHAVKEWVRAIQQLVILAQQVNPDACLPPEMTALTFKCPRCSLVVLIDNEDLRLTE